MSPRHARRSLPDHGDEVVDPVVDAALGTQRATGSGLLVAPAVRRPGHRSLGDLDRGDADAAGPAMHQDHVARLARARSKRLVQTVKNVSGRLAASTAVRPAGIGRHCTAGAVA